MVARCAASTSSRRAPGMPAAMRSPCSGGVAGSWRPAMTSVGARMAPSSRDEVHVLDGRAAAGVALVGRRREHGAHRRGLLGLARDEALGQPAPDAGVGDRLDALGADRRGAIGPHLRRPQARRGAAQHEPVDALGRVDGQPHPDHPAQREAAPVHALEPQAIEEGQRVGAEVVERIRARAAPASRRGRGGRSARRAGARPARDLRVPHRARAPQRVGEDEHGPVVGTGDLVADVDGSHERWACALSARSMSWSVAPR